MTNKNNIFIHMVETVLFIEAIDLTNMSGQGFKGINCFRDM